MDRLYSRRLPWLGGLRRISNAALTAPSPSDGEELRTALPDNFDGIRFEIGRMIQYVRDAAKDPLVAAHVREICEKHFALNGPDGERNPERTTIEAIDAWCRAHFAYVNDPPNVEVLQTPRRMIKETRVPSEVIRHVIDPLLAAASTVAPPGFVESYEPPPLTAGDCDEGATLFVALCAATPAAGLPPIRPLRFQFGGHDDTLHHVWSLVGEDGYGKLVASDLTEPGYKLGDFSKFDHYEEVEVPLP